jgi:hypothetical protein
LVTCTFTSTLLPRRSAVICAPSARFNSVTEWPPGISCRLTLLIATRATFGSTTLPTALRMWHAWQVFDCPGYGLACHSA